jgi:hypothetical protein
MERSLSQWAMVPVAAAATGPATSAQFRVLPTHVIPKSISLK